MRFLQLTFKSKKRLTVTMNQWIQQFLKLLKNYINYNYSMFAEKISPFVSLIYFNMVFVSKFDSLIVAEPILNYQLSAVGLPWRHLTRIHLLLALYFYYKLVDWFPCRFRQHFILFIWSFRYLSKEYRHYQYLHWGNSQILIWGPIHYFLFILCLHVLSFNLIAYLILYIIVILNLKFRCRYLKIKQHVRFWGFSK